MPALTKRKRLALRLRPETPGELKEAREILELTQEGMALALGLKEADRAQVSQWEAGKYRPSAQVLEKYAALLEES